jgi:hypothetical protein
VRFITKDKGAFVQLLLALPESTLRFSMVDRVELPPKARNKNWDRALSGEQSGKFLYPHFGLPDFYLNGLARPVL